MASNPSDRSSPLAADEAERLASNFRPVWDVDDSDAAAEAHAVLSPEPALIAPPAAVPLNVSRKATLIQWSPSAVSAAPAPAPAPAADTAADPLPLPAPVPTAVAAPQPGRSGPRRAAPLPVEASVDAAGEAVTSSDGATAISIAQGPTLPPKPTAINVQTEPSVVVSGPDSAPEPERPGISAAELEARRRQTTRIDSSTIEEASRILIAKGKLREADAFAPAAAKPARAPLPEVTDDDTVPPTFGPRKSSRLIVVGAVSAAALLTVLALFKFFSKGEEPQAVSPVASQASPAPSAAATGAGDDPARPGSKAAVPEVTTAATDLPAAKDPPPPRDTRRDARGYSPPVKPPPADDPAKTSKKPVKGGSGTIVRDVPFLSALAAAASAETLAAGLREALGRSPLPCYGRVTIR